VIDRIGPEGVLREWIPSGLGGHDGMAGETAPVDGVFNAVRTSRNNKGVVTATHEDDMRYPRDPLGPARQIINCGCQSFLVIPA
jgi:hypothetical protein